MWLAHPELAADVDFIGTHIWPYWDGVPVEDAVPYVLRRYKELQAAFPGKKIVIAETGWPAAGRYVVKTPIASVPAGVESTTGSGCSPSRRGSGAREPVATSKRSSSENAMGM